MKVICIALTGGRARLLLSMRRVDPEIFLREVEATGFRRDSPNEWTRYEGEILQRLVAQGDLVPLLKSYRTASMRTWAR